MAHWGAVRSGEAVSWGSRRWDLKGFYFCELVVDKTVNKYLRFFTLSTNRPSSTLPVVRRGARDDRDRVKRSEK